MIKHSESTAPNPNSPANDLYEQLLQSSRTRASHSVHTAKHKSNIRNLIIVSCLLIAGILAVALTNS
ncbi:hypothetical protein [Marinomonas ostreistagni]|uniref:hypothetical protein n=1 Tax=Marinomonas ostreistagni TaxID=359209 RepID=UPI00194EC4E0|nr:hypothetical protein [Marinomonas ostreistagni]MBM6550038.1 hypothetical protein [Marinomonas ostreistagni]